MDVIRDPVDMADFSGGAFVPTMGSLHPGHVQLIRRAATLGRPVVMSLFVNPTQFGPGEDYERYPRRLEADVAVATEAGADVVFVPSVDDVYPRHDPPPVPPLPAVATEPGLEDAVRPHHFAGVCQVVARLFDLTRPRWAVFGEKDYQQMLVVAAMVAQETPRWGDLTIVACATSRDPDGLAMSSRNALIEGGTQRDRALGLVRALRGACGTRTPDAGERALRAVLAEHDLDVDYAVVRDAATLGPATPGAEMRGLIAARLGRDAKTAVRLIDNMALGPRVHRTRVLVFGGTFDPPHRAHVELPTLVARKLGCDQVIYMPAAQNPLKTDAPGASAAQRLAMLQLVKADATISTLEIDRAGPSYFVDTLTALRAELGPDVDLRFLIGADQAVDFQRWKDWRRILDLATPVVVLRPPWTMTRLGDALRDAHGIDTAPAAQQWLDWTVETPLVDVNSTALRIALARGTDPGDALPPEVARYIAAHGLYRDI